MKNRAKKNLLAILALSSALTLNSENVYANFKMPERERDGITLLKEDNQRNETIRDIRLGIVHYLILIGDSISKDKGWQEKKNSDNSLIYTLEGMNFKFSLVINGQDLIRAEYEGPYDNSRRGRVNIIDDAIGGYGFGPGRGEDGKMILGEDFYFGSPGVFVTPREVHMSSLRYVNHSWRNILGGIFRMIDEKTKEKSAK